MTTELTRVKSAAYGRYEELLLKRDQLRREAASILTAYTKEFGDLITAVFEEKVKCIRQKKAIDYCQGMINRGLRIDIDHMHFYLNEKMRLYEEELQKMMKENDTARRAGIASPEEVQRAKKLYRKLARLLHPDINAKTREIPELADLWNRIMAAYHSNDPVELKDLEVLVGKVIRDLGIAAEPTEIPDIEKRIEALEDEINEIRTTEPYTYEILLADQELIDGKKELLRRELDGCRKYCAELTETLNALLAENGAQMIWTMN